MDFGVVISTHPKALADTKYLFMSSHLGKLSAYAIVIVN